MPKTLKRNIVVGVVGVLMLVSFFVVRTLIFVNAFATLSPSFDGICLQVSSPPGPEDIDIDRRSGIAYVSSTDRRALLAGDTKVQGDIFYFNLNTPDEGFVALNAGATEALRSFRPHGISLYQDEQGRATLMVVNHPSETKNRVEIFDLNSEEVDGHTIRQLIYRRTVEGGDLISPNDLIAVDHDRFYVTNDHGSTGNFGAALEDYLRLNKSSVAYFDGRELRIVADGLTYANGITISADGRQILVTETQDFAIRFYARDISSGALTLTDRIGVRTGVDNIDRAEDGSYWVGSHPQTLKFVAHAGDQSMPSPSHVIRLVPGPGGQGGNVEQVYLNLGDEISGSSVAAVHEGQMLIGQVFDKHILICDLP